MAACLMVNLDIHDAERFETYRQQVAPLVEEHGGRYLVRGGEVHPSEGDLGLKRLVILEFPSTEAARGLLQQPRVRAAPEAPPRGRALRHRAGRRVVAPGLTPGDGR